MLFDLIAVGGGTIELTDRRTRTVRSVDLAPYSIARAPVTVETFLAAVAGADGLQLGRRRDGQGSVPVHGVTWMNAVGWCNSASAAYGLRPCYVVEGRRVRWEVDADGFRLPTEAEWEFACRAGSTGAHYGYLERIAWTALDGVAGPQPTGLKEPNGYGLVDTLGNVWEWCWDLTDTARYGDYRALRGGGWADRPWSVRASARRGSAPDAVLEDAGFRVAQGPVGGAGDEHAQGWSRSADRDRAGLSGPRPLGWTPLDAELR